jgi:transcriptional/translational regulatory protein YebC/TACO1
VAILEKILRMGEGRVLKKLEGIAAQVNAYEDAYADYTDFGSLAQALDALDIEPTKAALEYIPNTPVEFTEEQLADIEKLIDRLEDDDDVQAVFTNIA